MAADGIWRTLARLTNGVGIVEKDNGGDAKEKAGASHVEPSVGWSALRVLRVLGQPLPLSARRGVCVYGSAQSTSTSVHSRNVTTSKAVRRSARRDEPFGDSSAAVAGRGSSGRLSTYEDLKMLRFEPETSVMDVVCISFEMAVASNEIDEIIAPFGYDQRALGADRVAMVVGCGEVVESRWRQLGPDECVASPREGNRE
jgi:hypothetical protein